MPGPARASVKIQRSLAGTLPSPAPATADTLDIDDT